MRHHAGLYRGSPFALDATSLTHLEAHKQQELLISDRSAIELGLGQLDAGKLALGQLDTSALALGRLDASQLALGQVDASSIALGRLAKEQHVFHSAAEQALGYGRRLADEYSSHQIANEWIKQSERELSDASKQIQQFEAAYKPLTDLAEHLYREQTAGGDAFANLTRGLDSSIAQALGSGGLQELWKSAATLTDQLHQLAKDASYAEIVQGALWATQAITRDLRQAGFDRSATDTIHRQQQDNAYEAVREQLGISDRLIDRVIVADPPAPANETGARIGALILAILKVLLLPGLSRNHDQSHEVSKAVTIAVWIVLLVELSTGENPRIVLHDLIKESIHYFEGTPAFTSDQGHPGQKAMPIPHAALNQNADAKDRKGPEE